MDTLKHLIKNFCKKYELVFYDNCILKKVSNISEFIRNDNSTYYYDRKDLIDNAYGMLYEDSSKQWIILIDENQNPADFFATLIHEYVHLCDYKKLTEIRNNLPLRELQNDYVFLYWTEFHATYLSNRFLIGFNPTGINVNAAQNQIVVELTKYYSSSLKLNRAESMDKTVRSYGSYLALYDEFCTEMSLYPDQYYYNKVFLEIYRFLKGHKTFDTFIAAYNDFHNLLLEI